MATCCSWLLLVQMRYGRAALVSQKERLESAEKEFEVR
jgi:hypothetical protein